jgi:hypothetical protein
MKKPLLRYCRQLSLVTLLIIVVGCSADRPQEKSIRTLFDFEKTEELDLLHWQCGSFMEQDAEHATSGKYSLRVEMYPSEEYPGFQGKLYERLAGVYKAAGRYVSSWCK